MMLDLLLAVPPALAIGLSLGLLGGGGSILTVPVLVYGFGLEPKSAIATSLVIVGITSLGGAVRHGRHGQVDLPLALSFGLGGILGASAASRIAASDRVPAPLLMAAFAALMIVVSISMLRSARRGEPEPGTTRRHPLRIGGFGLLTGLLTGALGVGGGFVVVPALLLAGGLSIHRAIGSSLVVIALNCAAGLVGFLGRIPVEWPLALAFAVVGVAGSVAGARLAARTRPARLRRGFGALVLGLGILMLADQAVRAWGRG